MKVEFATGVFSSGIPDAESIVFTAGKEVVLARMKGEARDVLLMAFKVPQVRIVMRGEISYCVYEVISKFSRIARSQLTILLRT